MRLIPSLAGLCLYLVFAGLWRFAPGAYAWALHAADAMPQTPQPFSDLGAILQAGACWRQGVNVYAPSACMHGGVFNYSPFLLHAARLPIGPADRVPGGILFGLAFLLSLAWLPPAASRAELEVRILATCSSTVIFALERANLDVGIFLLVLLGLALLLANRWAAIAGYAVFLIGAAAKFYPAVLLGLLLRERLVFLLSAMALAGAAGVLYLAFFAHGTLTALQILPVGLPFGGMFGATDLCFGLVLEWFMPVLTLSPNAAQYLAGVQHADAVTIIELGSKLLTILAILAGVRLAPSYGHAFRRLPEHHALLLIAGAMVIVFCFFLAQNIPYRGIFLLMTLPGLYAMRLSRILFVVMVLLWRPALINLTGIAARHTMPHFLVFYPKLLFWLFAECLWWWLIIQFLAICVCFLRVALSRRREEAASWSG